MKRWLMMVPVMMSLVACGGMAGSDLDVTWCLAGLNDGDTTLVLEAAQEWHDKTNGAVNFSFTSAANRSECGDSNYIRNIRQADADFSGHTLWIDPDLLSNNPATGIELNIVQFTDPATHDNNYRAVVLHEMGHYLMDSFFGANHHSSDIRDQLYNMFPGDYGVFHLSEGDIANFWRANPQAK